MSTTDERAPEPTERDPNAADAPSGGQAPRRRRRGRRRPRAAATETAAAQPEPERVPAADDPARVLADSLQAAVLRHTTAAVLGRGRGYAKRNRVTELRVSAGRVRARVLGSDRARYRVELVAPQRPAPAVVSKIRWACDCPYAAEHRRGTCKHVVAVALVAAKRLERTEAMRRRWLGQPAANAPEAEPAEFDALAERLLAAFSAPPLSIDEVLDRALAIAPPPFDVPARHAEAG